MTEQNVPRERVSLRESEWLEITGVGGSGVYRSSIKVSLLWLLHKYVGNLWSVFIIFSKFIPLSQGICKKLNVKDKRKVPTAWH